MLKTDILVKSHLANDATGLLERVDVIDRDGNIVVCPIWRGVDRPSAGGISLGHKDDKSVSRYLPRVVACILAGAFHEVHGIKTDVYGKTYVNATAKVYGRHLNADLKKLGF